MDLVNQSSYPLNQRVIRLKELPMKCRAEDIRKYFKSLFLFTIHFFLNTFDRKCFMYFIIQIGLLVTEVHLIFNKAYHFKGEAFVMFETVEDIELALGSVTKDNNKIQNKQIKVFRSSQEQFKTYCDMSTIKKVSSCLKKEQKINQSEDLGEPFMQFRVL